MSAPGASNPLMSPLSEGTMPSPSMASNFAYQPGAYRAHYFPTKPVNGQTVNYGPTVEINEFGMLTPASSPIKADAPVRAFNLPAAQYHQRPNSILLTPPSEEAQLPAKLSEQSPLKKAKQPESATPKKSAGRGRPKKGAKTVQEEEETPKPKRKTQSAAGPIPRASIIFCLVENGVEVSENVVDLMLTQTDTRGVDAAGLCSLYESAERDYLRRFNSQMQPPSPAPSPVRDVHPTVDVETKTKSRGKKRQLEPESTVMPFSPALSVHVVERPVIATFQLTIDPITGIAAVEAVPGSSTFSAHSSMPSLSGSSSISDTYSPQALPIDPSRRKMQHANVPGMGRVLFEENALVGRLGENAAKKAMFGLERPAHYQPATNRSISKSAEREKADQRIRLWIEQDLDSDDDTQDRLSAFLTVPLDSSPLKSGGKSAHRLKRSHAEAFVPALPFPAERQSHSRASSDGHLACVCGGSNQESVMVQCDVCRAWMHLECVGLDESSLPEQWYCHRCAGHAPPQKALPGTVLMQREPTLVANMSPQQPFVTRFAQMDYTLTSPFPVNNSGNMYVTPAMQQDPRFVPQARRPSAGHTRKHSNAHWPLTPRLSKSSGTATDYTFSPKTPAVGSFGRVSRNGFDNRGSAWDVFEAGTPSRSAGVCFGDDEWNDPAFQTPITGSTFGTGVNSHFGVGGYRKPDNTFLNTMSTPSQVFFNTLQTPLSQHPMTFGDSPELRRGSQRFHEMLQSPRVPSRSAGLARSASGLGIGIGHAQLDEFIM